MRRQRGFYNSAHERLRPRPEPHHRAARPARPVRVRARAAGAHAARLPRAPAARHARGRARLDLQPHRAVRRAPTAALVAARRSTGWPSVGGVAAQHAARRTPTCCEGGAAARHAFRVASGLDSMVLGEPQILGQMKQAVREAETAGTLGSTLHQLFQRSFAVAKEVRTSTEIGAHSISMAAAAVRLAVAAVRGPARDQGAVRRRRRDDRAGRHALRGARSRSAMAVANRTLERGEKLAGRFGAEAMRLADLPARLHEFDAVISCTASTLPIIGLGAVERALKAAQAPPDVHGRPGGAARHRARGRRACPTSTSTPSTTCRRWCRRAGEKRQAAVRAGRGHHRDRRAELRALARPARRGAADPGAAHARPTTGAPPRSPARASCSRAARTSTRCSKRCRAA